MKNKLLLVVLVVCIGIFCSACTTFQASGLQVGTNTSGVEILGDFRTSVIVNKFLGVSGGPNFLNLSSSATDGRIRSAIDNEIRKMGGTAAINVSLRYRTGPLQQFLNGFTGFIWAPSTLVITGTVIRE